MATFQIPQFIEQKAKIVGPLTLPQFLMLVGAAVIGVISFYVFNLFLFVIITLIAGVIAGAFAFVKINGRPLTKMFIYALRFASRPHIYTWRREAPTMMIDTAGIDRLEALRKQMNVQEKLKAISSFLTTRTTKTAQNIRGGQAEEYTNVRYASGESRVAKRVDYKA